MKKGEIRVNDVSMMFNLSTEKIDNLKEYVIRILKRTLSFREFWAVKNVSITVQSGDRVGIIGLNGSGKSTLLKLIAGVLKPTQGTVVSCGKIAPLIELGAGFDQDLSVRENIFLNGAILGYSHKAVELQYDQIIAFSELEEFQEVAIKNLSSGMVARLGFSIATTEIPDILIVDEILSVGDYAFQKKCHARMHEMTQAGTTILFVSHSIEQVKELCNRGVWLKRGVMQLDGEASDVCEAYLRDLEKSDNQVEIEEKSEQLPPVKRAAEETIKKQPNYQFIPWLRVIACLMVMYVHVIPSMLIGLGISWRPMELITNNIVNPLGIYNHFAFLGVVIFFLVSGFLTMQSSKVESSRCFWINRIKKIYPGLIIAVFGLYLIQLAFGAFTAPTYWAQFSFQEWCRAGTLFDYIIGSSNKIIVVTWYLGVLLFFYLLHGILLPVRNTRPQLYCVAMLAICSFAYIIAPYMPDKYNAYASLIGYIPIIYLGQLLYLVHRKEISSKSFVVFSFVAYLLIIKNLSRYSPNSFIGENPMGVSVIYGYSIFVVALLLERHIKAPAFVCRVDKISYQLYLVHMPIGQLLMPVLVRYISVSLALVVTFAFIFLAAIVQQKIVFQIIRLINIRKLAYRGEVL